MKKIQSVANIIATHVKKRIDAIENCGYYTPEDNQYFAKMERRMMFLAKGAGQEDFELYSQLVKTGWTIRNATVFTGWTKSPNDVISLLTWVKSQL